MSKVLVIEDDAQVRDVIGRMLVSGGHQVVELADGRGVVDECERFEPDVVVTDMLMPDTDGIEAIMALRRRFRDLPIVAISGGGSASSGHYLEMARNFGATGVLAKPFSSADLLTAVADVLHNGDR